MRDQIRKCHWLSRNRTTRRPEAVIFFDTEASIARPDARLEQHTFRLASACYAVYDTFAGLLERDWRSFQSERALWAWIDGIAQQHQETLVVSHNIDYDARVSRAFHYLPRFGWTPAWCVMSPSCNVFEFKHEKRRVTLLDNLNLFRSSLAELGKSVGLEKLEVDFEAVGDDQLAVYCHRDVEILVETWRQWLDFLDRHDLGDFGVTIAKQSFNAYRHRFMPVKIGIHSNAAALELERAAYRGGRSECFRVGQLPPEKYYKIDANGLYSAMMAWYKYPRRLVKVIQNVDAAYLDVLLRNHLAIAEVVIDTDQPRFPVRIRGRNAYPTGSFITTLSTPELQIALLDGEIKAIGRVALYEPADLFSDYISLLTPLRQQYKLAGDLARSQMCKLLRNSLQGKFGQRGYHQKRLGEAPLDVVRVKHWINGETGETVTDLTFGGATLRQWRAGEMFDSFPAIPAHVAAYGRMYMLSLIEQAGRRNVFYIDTDGLIVNQAGLDRLAGVLDANELGMLKIESVSDDVEIRAKKDYRFGKADVIKGVRRSAERVSNDVYEQWHFTTLRWGFQVRNLDGVTLHKVRKELSRGVTAGTLRDDGWIEPPRVHLTPDQVLHLEPGPGDGKAWVWEIDPTWLTRLGLKDDLAWRLARSRGWHDASATSRPLPLRPVELA